MATDPVRVRVRPSLRIVLLAWAAVTVVGTLVIASVVAIPQRPAPDASARRWAFAALDAMRRQAPLPAPPASAEGYRAAGPIVVEAYQRGRLVRAERLSPVLSEAVTGAAAAFSGAGGLAAHPGWSREARAPLRFAIAIPTGTGPLLDWIPGLSLFALVPLKEGVVAQRPGTDSELWLTPHAVWASGLLDRAVVTPIPDLSFGLDLGRLRALIAARMGLEQAYRGRLRRFAAVTWTRDPYPGPDAISRPVLAEAVREAVTFLVRHQDPSGRFAYRYDARADRQRPGYSLARHAGTTFFLAQAARTFGLAEARLGARRALRWVQRAALSRCGPHPCVGRQGIVTLGATALTALAAAEFLRGGESAPVAKLLDGLTDHLRAMQRPDGELMHDYDRKRSRAIDRQHMYYSGEAALALLRAHRVTSDPRNVSVVRALMGHLTGSGWRFFGSRYFYGEEHWTCQAAAAAADRMPVHEGIEFCLRWLAWQGRLQYRAGQTPWPASGSYGVGPVLLPRITAIASRVEAGVPVLRVARAQGSETAWLEAQLQRSVRALLRFRWAPGPVHLVADPAAALGGFPGTQASFEVRNDFVQHAGSALLAWWTHMGEAPSPPARP